MANKMKSPQMSNPYGLSINLAAAKKIAAAAAREVDEAILLC